MRIKAVILSSMMALGISHGYAQELSWDEKETLRLRMEECVYDFLSYIPEIAGKKNKSYEEQQLAQKYITKALGLFIGRGEDYEYLDQAGNKRLHQAVKVQTKRGHEYTQGMPIKRYLERLMHLPYQQISIDTWYGFRMDSLVHDLGEGLYIASGTMVFYSYSKVEDKYIQSAENSVKTSLYVKREEYEIGPHGDRITIWSSGKLGDLKISTRWK